MRTSLSLHNSTYEPFHHSTIRYMEANKRCKEADKVIEFETTNVQKLAAVVDNSFEQVKCQGIVNIC